MQQLEHGTLVLTTFKLTGDCGMFSVNAGTIAKVVFHYPHRKKVKIVVTPYDKGYITTDDRCIRKLVCIEAQIAEIRFNKIPKYTFEPATFK